MCGFNPRSREGATFTADREDRAILVSIHAPAKERHYLQFLFYAKNEFQSTLPRRSDKSCTGATEREDMFQSTLPRRSDTISLRADRGLRSFNPRSREGATHSEQSNNKRIVFQSTLPRRSDSIYHQFSFSNIQYSLTFCTNRTFQNLQISFDKCPFNTFCYFFRCESPDIFMYTVDSHRTRTT